MTAPSNSMHERRVCRRQQGFTLLELMTTLLVVGVLLSVGVPGFFDIIRNNRAAANANELVTALSIARSEAVRRGARVGVCPSTDGTSCSGSDWSGGWLVFLDGAISDDDAMSVDTPLREWPAPTGDATVSVTSGGSGASVEWVRFLPRGDVRLSNTGVALPIAFELEIDGCSGMQGRSIVLNATGRARAERVAC